VAVAVPSSRPSTATATTLPASAVPEISGCDVLMLAGGPKSTGAAGATVSTTKVRTGEEALVLPAASVAVALTVCVPWASGVADVKLQSPEALAVTVPPTPPSTLTSTMLPASAVPAMTGIVVLTSTAGAVSTGASGGTLS